jgi:hypothetical protein
LTAAHIWMVVLLWTEFLRYEIWDAPFGFRATYRQLRGQKVGKAASTTTLEALRRANSVALSLYFKPIACLQRSVALARVMRRYGVDAQVVIGYHAQPFFSHCWVEVDRVIVNDSQGYGRMLCELDRL